MPIYEYQCDGCGEVFEVLQRLSDPPPASHEGCGSTSVHRVMSAAAFVFKGDGWYVTDYARKDKDKASGGKKSKDKDSDKGSGSGSSGGSTSSGSSSGGTSSGGSTSGTPPASSGTGSKTAAA